MTPNDIDVLIHYYVWPAPHPRITAPAVRDAISMWVKNGVLEYIPEEKINGANLRTTERGRVLIEKLCATPLPVQRWE